MTDGSRPRQASDLTTRFVAGVAMIAVALLAIYLGGWPFRILVAAAAAVMLLEWSDIHRVARIWAYVGMALLAAALLVVVEWLYPVAAADPAALNPEIFASIWIGVGVMAVLAVLLGLVSRRGTMITGFVYIALPSLALMVLRWAWFELVFWVMIVTWATDIFAYFAGRGIGGPKLAPRISPNKTWAGLAGGVIGAALLGWLVARWFDLGAPFLFIGGLMGLVAQAGDLYESWVKRRAGVKDSGAILPGHGGVLDRLDGLLPVALITFLLLFDQWTG
jgi:phosphatidate cytidylyltransferase